MSTFCDKIVDVVNWVTVRCVRKPGHIGECSCIWDMIGR